MACRDVRGTEVFKAMARQAMGLGLEIRVEQHGAFRQSFSVLDARGRRRLYSVPMRRLAKYLLAKEESQYAAR